MYRLVFLQEDALIAVCPPAPTLPWRAFALEKPYKESLARLFLATSTAFAPLTGQAAVLAHSGTN